MAEYPELRRRCRSGFCAALLSFAAACGGSSGTTRSMTSEAALRARLGVPPEAERVLLASQSAHLDLNYMDTFDGYYDSSIRWIFHDALDVLDQQPDYHYSIAEVAWVRRYWDDHPADRERMKAAAERGALKIVGGGLASPDTILPTGESLMRDWQLGIEWTRKNLGVTPTSAWQPDSFGHAATLPSILEQFGFRSVGFARVDGGTDGPDPDGSPTPGDTRSTAATLRDAHSAAFVWQAPDGAEVLAHWMPYGYGMGDDLDFSNPLTGLSGIGINWNVPAFTDASVTNDRFAGYIDKLEPYRTTPYLFLPVGGDFTWPKHPLLDYARKWNTERYPSTGVWIAVGTFEDYTSLIDARRAELPALALDINPYWTGFYDTHAGLKDTVRQANAFLTSAEKLGAIASAAAGGDYPFDVIDSGWDSSAFMDHHDAITGTTTSAGLAVDLVPWSENAWSQGNQALSSSIAELAKGLDTPAVPGGAALLLVANPASWERAGEVETSIEVSGPGDQPVAVDPEAGVLPTQVLGIAFDEHRLAWFADVRVETPPLAPLSHRTWGVALDGAPGVARASLPSVKVELLAAGQPVDDVASADTIVLENGTVRAVIAQEKGYCLASIHDASGAELLNGPSNDIVTYRDLGGAYRIGSEMGRTFQEIASSCTPNPARTVELVERGPVSARIRLTEPSELGPLVREIVLGASSPGLELDTTLAAPDLTTVVARFRTPMHGDRLTTSVPFGELARPRRKLFDPTFWPVTEWADLASPTGSGGLWLSFQGSRGVAASADGVAEVMLTRNTFWDFLGPGGEDRQSYTTRIEVGGRPGASWLDGQSYRRSTEAREPVVVQSIQRAAGTLPASRSWLSIDRADVTLSTLKRAYDRSDDLVMRLVRHGDTAGPVHVTTALSGFDQVWAVNGLEDAIDGVAVTGTGADFTVDMSRAIRNVRFHRSTARHGT